jgi:nucleoside-diphosphate-sugar epimerase
MARGFYAENRRITNTKAKRLLNWVPRHANYRLGLQALLDARRVGSEAQKAEQ